MLVSGWKRCNEGWMAAGVRQAIESGEYRVNPDAVADAIVRRMLERCQSSEDLVGLKLLFGLTSTSASTGPPSAGGSPTSPAPQ